MAKHKNALRGHFIAPFTSIDAKPSTDAWLELARWISDITDDTDEKVDEQAYYDSDGTEETVVTGVKVAYSFEGLYDPEDKAQKHIADLKLKLGNDRFVWHKVVSADKKKEWVGLATVTEIIAGSGAASEYEKFGCKISYNSIPEESVPVGG
ncbi:TPA: phage tail protein [Streptococcus suis]|nr:phage tail protein [Streptococcus suis]HEM4700434.1 phage tail protein [Streptococcus suis]HEM4717582.1 phage tail protein [Streptococcus suis]HEM4752976.1 phage tail protein [Streptococcus suis]HEM4776303.1 phage tail protein [Streptococcus suis]